MSRSRWTLFALLLILLLAAGLRLYHLDAQSLWYDEGASLGHAQRTLAGIWHHTAADFHPPAYYVLLSAWIRLLGTSELTLRGMSVALGLLLVAQVYSLGRKLFNPTTGLLAAALVAVDPFDIYYSQEARMYALLAALAAASLWLFLKWLEALQAPDARPARAWLLLIGLALVNAAALYTHYVYPVFIAVETLLFLAWWLWESGSPRRASPLGAWVGAQLFTLLLYLPWLPTALHNMVGSSGPEMPFTPGQGLLDMASVLAYGVTLPASAAVVGLVPLGLLALIGLLPPVDERAVSRPSHAWRVGLLLTWLLLPVMTMFAFRLYEAGYLDSLLSANAVLRPGVGRGSFSRHALRFLLPADFALALLLARGLWMGFLITRPGLPGSARGGWMALVVVVLAAVGLAPTLDSLDNLYFDPAYARDDYRALARHLEEVVGPDDAIILDGPGQWDTFTYYYPPHPTIHPLPMGDTGAELEETLAASRRIYAVFYGEVERDPQRVVEDTLDARAFEAETRWYGNVRLVTYGVSAAPVEEPAVTLDARFGQTVRLLGYTLDARDARPGGLLNVALFWRADAPLDESYSVFVHLLGSGSDVPLAQHDGVPGGGLAFTDTWTPGQTVRDHHGVLIPQDISPGEYTLVVGMYEPESGQRLSVVLDGSGVGDRLPLSPISLE